jgi:hypothetical protein
VQWSVTTAVRFDDRLNTVLGQEPTDAHDRAVRWRQLVELLARSGEPSSPLVRQALDTITNEAPEIDPQLRAATARAIARPHLPVELVELFAADSLQVSAPVLAAVKLSRQEWQRVLDQASPDSRRFLRALHPELDRLEPRVTPEADLAEPFQTQAAKPPAARVAAGAAEAGTEATAGADKQGAAEPGAAIPSISDVLARIERLRQERQGVRSAVPDHGQGRQPGGSPAMFRWECGPSGEIGWVEGIPRGALIGRSLAAPGPGAEADRKIRDAFDVRAPFREASLAIAAEGAAAGEWKLSGLPAFEPRDGRFAGYRGIASRADAAQGGEGVESPLSLDPDSLRDLVHELRTPLNAIIGFAEMIEGQYLGPADNRYRQRAGEIAAQARLLLSAIEDLDLAAQLSSAREPAGGATDLRELVAQASSELVERTGRRGASLLLDLPPQPVLCRVEKSLAIRMVRRFCGSVLDAARQGERLSLVLCLEPERCLLSLAKPKLLGAGAAPGASAERLPTDLSLRLITALARVVGGDVVEADDRLTLVLPRAQ